jgi:hypothetical protein
MKQILFTTNKPVELQLSYNDIINKKYIVYYDIEIICDKVNYGILPKNFNIFIDNERWVVKYSNIDYNHNIICTYITKY